MFLLMTTYGAAYDNGNIFYVIFVIFCKNLFLPKKIMRTTETCEHKKRKVVVQTPSDDQNFYIANEVSFAKMYKVRFVLAINLYRYNFMATQK